MFTDCIVVKATLAVDRGAGGLCWAGFEPAPTCVVEMMGVKWFCQRNNRLRRGEPLCSPVGVRLVIIGRVLNPPLRMRLK